MSATITRLTEINDKMKLLRQDPTLEADLIAIMLTLKGIAATPADIKTSAIHLTMNDLKKSTAPAVAQAAKDVIVFWKSGAAPITATANPMETATSSTTKDKDVMVQIAPLAPAEVKTAAPTPTCTTETPADNSASVFKRKTLQPEFLMGRTSSAVRDGVQKLFFQALEPKNVEQAVLFELAVTIELELFKHFKGESPEYKSRARMLYANLKDPKNPDFSDSLIDGMILPSELPTLDDKSMASKDAQKRMQDLLNYEMAKRTTDDGTGDGQGVDIFQCPQCKKKNCSYYQKQTRSADEPMTVFCHCLECGKRFRIYP